MKRFISLYYGSAGIGRAIQMLGVWIAGVYVSADVFRDQLVGSVKRYFGQRGVFAFGSGRGALAACLRAAGIRPRDTVLLSAYTCLAVPTAVIAVGARPAYIDIDPRTLNVSVAEVLASLNSSVRAIVVQHTLGNPAPIEAIVDAARQRGILVIEDCALCVGSKKNGRLLGTFGDAAIVSMELSKTLSSGWGGILIVSDRKLALAVTELYKSLHEPSWVASTRDSWQTIISGVCHHPALYNALGKYLLYAGFKSGLFRFSTPRAEFDGEPGSEFITRMGGPQAGLAAIQWNNLETVAAECHANAKKLRTTLQDLNLVAPGSPGPNDESVAPRVSFLVSDPEAAIAYFRARGVELGLWFNGPLSPLPTSSLFRYHADLYPRAMQVARHVVNIPCHSRLSAADLEQINSALRDFVRSYPQFSSSD